MAAWRAPAAPHQRQSVAPENARCSGTRDATLGNRGTRKAKRSRELRKRPHHPGWSLGNAWDLGGGVCRNPRGNWEVRARCYTGVPTQLPDGEPARRWCHRGSAVNPLGVASARRRLPKRPRRISSGSRHAESPSERRRVPPAAGSGASGTLLPRLQGRGAAPGAAAVGTRVGTSPAGSSCERPCWLIRDGSVPASPAQPQTPAAAAAPARPQTPQSTPFTPNRSEGKGGRRLPPRHRLRGTKITAWGHWEHQEHREPRPGARHLGTRCCPAREWPPPRPPPAPCARRRNP